jgi:hypothetical protein
MERVREGEQEHTFHCLHKDLLLFGGVLLVQEEAVEDASKRA